MTDLDRRAFLTSAAVMPLGLGATSCATSHAGRATTTNAAVRPVVIASGNGLPAVTRAYARLRGGAEPVEAVVDGVAIVEADPTDQTVGYGGLPNADGVVQLDASVMHGPMHRAGAVAALERIKHPARVALQVMRLTDHVMLVGDDARRFAVAHGHPEEELLTDAARDAWLRWKQHQDANGRPHDSDQSLTAHELDPQAARSAAAGVPFTYGTIHCAAVDAHGDLGACTTTSGLSYKVPGRVGDSPIVGAGMFVDNEVGAAGATGRGEALIQSCGAFQIVQHMANGDDPETACLKLLKWIADHTRRASLLNARGEPNFGATVYALRKDGAFGCATIRAPHARLAVADASGARRMPVAQLYP